MIQSVDLAYTLRRLAARPCPACSNARARDEALEMMARETLARPAFGYRIVSVEAVRGDTVVVEGVALDAPALVAEKGELKAVVAAACTLGSAVQERISALFATRRRSLALAMDTLANELLFRLADRAFATIRREARRSGLCIGIEGNPGDPGVPLAQQARVLALAGAAQIGIRSTDAGVLSPTKSLSFFVALGPNSGGRAAQGRCKRCDSRDRCTVK